MGDDSRPGQPRYLHSKLLMLGNDELGNSLRDLPMFSGLPAEVIQSLGPKSGILQAAEGDSVLTQGQVNTHLFVLLEGRLGVYVSGERIAELKRRGDLVGEMSVISKTPCSASVIAETPAELFAVDMSAMRESYGSNAELNVFLYKLYSAILVDRLMATNAKARQYEETNRALQVTKDALQRSNDELEEKVFQRTRDLKSRTDELEAQNAALLASHRRIDDLYRSRTNAMERLTEVVKNELSPLRSTLQGLSTISEKNVFVAAANSLRNLEKVQDVMAPLTTAYFAERAVASSRVLFAEEGAKEAAIARMALGGTGVDLDVVTDLEAGKKLIAERSYDVVCTNLSMVDLTTVARAKNPGVKTALVTSAPGADIIAKLKAYPHLSNIVARSDTDRTFTVKNILTTVTKLVSGDIFGVEKFLSWGVEVQSRTVVASTVRHDHVEEVQDYFSQLGATSRLVTRIAMVTEELLTNAIFDAPHDAAGNPRYNFQARTTPVTLEAHEYATLRFAADGILAAVSVEDPFGALNRATILDYLDRCYRGEFSHPDKRKGGGGLGTFQMMEMADLVVYNVRPQQKTEVIALFALESEARTRSYKSFHYFGG